MPSVFSDNHMLRANIMRPYPWYSEAYRTNARGTDDERYAKVEKNYISRRFSQDLFALLGLLAILAIVFPLNVKLNVDSQRAHRRKYLSRRSNLMGLNGD